MSDPYNFPPGTLPQPEQEDDQFDPLTIDMGDAYDVPRDDEGLGYPDDGGMFVPMGENEPEEKGEPQEFDANLAEFMDESELNKIASDLLRGIEQDFESSAEWRENLSQGIKLLGLVVEPSSTDAGSTSTVFEGQHKTTHPLLLEACLLFQANARSSLLPASGPVKVRDDEPIKSQIMPDMPDQAQMPPMMGHNGGPPMEGGQQQGAPPVNINLQGGPQQQGQQPQKAYGGSVGNGYYAGGGMEASDDLDRPMPPHWVPWDEREGATGKTAADYIPSDFNRRDPERERFGGLYADGGGVNGYAEGGSPFGMGGLDGSGQGLPSPMGPMSQPEMGNGQMPMQQPPEPKTDRDILATALERDFNHYLTTTAQEYYSDTARMLFNVGLSGSGVKKVYNCPLRRRPVSETVEIEDFIVSNAFASLSNVPRITQRVTMRPSILKRMQLVKAYRDCDLGQPTDQEQDNTVREMKADVLGISISTSEDEDIDYVLYECYCELELDEFAPEQFKGKGLPLPYKVTIAKESQKILEIRRNWREDDEQCEPKEFFVDFSYVKAFGFYGLGLLHILGNTTRTLTAAWREFIDSGMFANFPGFVFAKGAGRQLTNNFRVPPGGGVGLDVGLADVRNAVMPLPYKDLGQAFVAFIQHVEEYGQRLGGTANTNIGEGRQDAPVGTTLALIEQATKPLGAVLKGLHVSQAKELQLLRDRFKEDPEAFWRFNRKPAMPWRKEQFIQALDDFDLVPVSDPNNPTNLHRIAKASIIQQIVSAAPAEFDVRKAIKRVFRYVEIDDIDDLFKEAGPPQPNPELIAAQAMQADVQQKAAANMAKLQSDMTKLQLQMQDKAAERVSRQQTDAAKLEAEKMKLASTLAIHSDRTELDAAERALRMQFDVEKASADHAAKREQGLTNATLQHNKTHMDAALKHHQTISNARAQRHKTMTDAELKRQQMEHAKQQAQTDAELKRQQIEAQQRNKSNG